MDHFAMLTPHERPVETVSHIGGITYLLCSKGYTFQEYFIKDLWNSLWTTRNSRWTTSGPLGSLWELLQDTDSWRRPSTQILCI